MQGPSPRRAGHALRCWSVLTSRGGTVLQGRERELAVIDQVLRDMRSGHSRVLVLRGEAGIGKTALLEEMVARADGVAVVRLSGVQSEGELAYGALHALWTQLSEKGVSRLPKPQQSALRITFGLQSGLAPNPLLVGLAMLNGLADLAEQQPLLVVVDDAQWLDHASAQTLGFAARRSQTEAVGLVFAVRETISELEGLLELPITGLAAEDARRLLGSVLQVQVDEVILERFIAETDGNPLALLELSHGLASADPGEPFDRRDTRDLWVRLEKNFQRRVEALRVEQSSLKGWGRSSRS